MGRKRSLASASRRDCPLAPVNASNVDAEFASQAPPLSCRDKSTISSIRVIQAAGTALSNTHADIHHHVPTGLKSRVTETKAPRAKELADDVREIPAVDEVLQRQVGMRPFKSGRTWNGQAHDRRYAVAREEIQRGISIEKLLRYRLIKLAAMREVMASTLGEQ